MSFCFKCKSMKEVMKMLTWEQKVSLTREDISATHITLYILLLSVGTIQTKGNVTLLVPKETCDPVMQSRYLLHITYANVLISNFYYSIQYGIEMGRPGKNGAS